MIMPAWHSRIAVLIFNSRGALAFHICE